MTRPSKDELLSASDLVQEEVPLPTLGYEVLVQGLGAKFSNEAQSKALKMVTVGSEQIATVDTAQLEAIQILNGMVDPSFDSPEEVEAFMEKCGPAVRAVVDKIDELSGLDKEAIAKAKAKFPGGEKSAQGSGEAVADGASDGSSGPAVSA